MSVSAPSVELLTDTCCLEIAPRVLTAFRSTAHGSIAAGGFPVSVLDTLFLFPFHGSCSFSLSWVLF